MLIFYLDHRNEDKSVGKRKKKEVISQKFGNVDDDEHDQIIFSQSRALYGAILCLCRRALSLQTCKRRKRLAQETDREKEEEKKGRRGRLGNWVTRLALHGRSSSSIGAVRLYSPVCLPPPPPAHFSFPFISMGIFRVSLRGLAGKQRAASQRQVALTFRRQLLLILLHRT